MGLALPAAVEMNERSHGVSRRSSVNHYADAVDCPNEKKSKLSAEPLLFWFEVARMSMTAVERASILAQIKTWTQSVAATCVVGSGAEGAGAERSKRDSAA